MSTSFQGGMRNLESEQQKSYTPVEITFSSRYGITCVKLEGRLYIVSVSLSYNFENRSVLSTWKPIAQPAELMEPLPRCCLLFLLCDYEDDRFSRYKAQMTFSLAPSARGLGMAVTFWSANANVRF